MPYNVIDPATAEAAPVLTVGAPRVNYGKTLGNMVDELRLQLMNRQDLGFTRLQEIVNDAYIDLATTIDLPALYSSYGLTTVAGQPFYLLPEQVHTIEDVSLLNTSDSVYGGRALIQTDRETYRMEEDVESQPVAFFRHGDVLVVWPTPNAAWTLAVDFKLRPLPLVNPTDSPMLSREWHELILKSARSKAHDALLEPALAAETANVYLALLRRKQDVLDKEETGRLIGSSVPRTTRDFIRRPRRRWFDAD